MSDDEYGVLDEGSIFRALTDHGVDFVVVGGERRCCGARYAQPVTSIVLPNRRPRIIDGSSTAHRRARADGPSSFADRGSR